MFIEKIFRADETVPLPLDTEILHFDESLSIAKAGCSGGSCEKCGTDLSTKIDELAVSRFLAASPKAASYVVLPIETLEAFKELQAGKTVRDVRQALVSRFGLDDADKLLRTILKNVVGRNFFEGADAVEATLNHPYMQMYVTNRCNLRCRHCYMSSGDPLPEGEVSTKDRIAVIEMFAELCPGSKITFTGGEALLDPDIFSLLERARSAGLRTELYSNGLTIKDAKTAQKVAGAVDEVQISIDGATALTNDFIRGKGTFAGIVRGIRLLDQAQANNNTTFRFRLAVTLTNTNSTDIRNNIHSFISGLNLQRRPEVRIGAIGKLGRAKESAELCADHDALLKTQAEIVNEFARSGMHRMQISTVNRFTRTCGMGLSITVGADGKIYPCTITEQKPIGNIVDANARSVIAGVIGYSKSTNVDNIEGCQNCGIRYFCGGICRITNLYKKKSMNVSACTPEYKNSQVRNLISRYDSYGLL